jgi:hypothetical protein
MELVVEHTVERTVVAHMVAGTFAVVVGKVERT